MTLESYLIANAGLMMVERLGYFGHHQAVVSHFDLTNDGFKVICTNTYNFFKKHVKFFKYGFDIFEKSKLKKFLLFEALFT